MTTYIPLETALYTLESAYLFSTVLLIAISCFGLAAISSLDKADKDSVLFRWFT